MKKYLLNIIIFSSILSAQEVYWVDGTNGNDSNNGTSEGAAFKTVKKAFSQSFSANFVDTIKVKAGTYDFEDNELRILNTPIELDDNSIEILKMLLNNERTTSNDVVVRLVENGLSYDYASKVKNKIIDSLNEKFKFITNSDTPFISVNKSPQDKRIQILEIIKYNKKEN